MHGNPGNVESKIRTAAELGSILRGRRREQHLTQEEVAILAGTHRNRIRELEHGEATERLALVLRVANELGLDLIVRPRDAHRGAAP